jgi:hypothetical protein
MSRRFQTATVVGDWNENTAVLWPRQKETWTGGTALRVGIVLDDDDYLDAASFAGSLTA